MAGVRFAPSPTGRFHVGNLRTAWISEQWARALNLPWVLRFEDIDTPRVLAGAQAQQLADLRALDLHPDAIHLQSSAQAVHFRFLRRAAQVGRIYPCRCSRREISGRARTSADFAEASAPHAPGLEYDGRCRERDPGDFAALIEPVSWRFRNEPSSGADDFIVARGPLLREGASLLPATDTVPAYNWACAVDDALGGYDLLVRAWDLESVAGPQRAVGRWVLSESSEKSILPDIYHAALITDDKGRRLEKRTQGVTLTELAARGVGPQELKDFFSVSYSQELEQGLSRYERELRGTEAIFGESLRARTLSGVL